MIEKAKMLGIEDLRLVFVDIKVILGATIFIINNFDVVCLRN